MRSVYYDLDYQFTVRLIDRGDLGKRIDAGESPEFALDSSPGAKW